MQKQIIAAAAAEPSIAKRSYNWVWRLRGLALPLLILLFWQLTAIFHFFEPSQLPPPVDVLLAAIQLVASGQLWLHLGASLGRVLIGFSIGSLLAIGLGLAVGLSQGVESFVAPTIQAIRAIPSLAWVPLLILWMGIDEGPKITLVAIGAFFPVYTTLVAGIRQIDRKLVEAGVAYGMHGIELAREVLLPAALPALFTGLRGGLAQAWLFLVAAELIAASRGLGFLLVDSQNTGRADIIVFSIMMLALLGKLSDTLLQRIEQRWLRWADTYKPL